MSIEPIVISTLCGKNSVDLILESFPTWFRYIEEKIIIRIYSDGSLDECDRNRVQDFVPSVQFIDDQVVGDRCKEILKDYPHCRDFRNFHPICRKLFDIPLNAERKIFFFDTDIFLNQKISLRKTFVQSEYKMIAMKDSHHCICPTDATLARLALKSCGGIRCAEAFNSGILYLDTANFDLEYVESLLANPLFQYGLSQGKWVWEQTVWAFLAYRVGCGYINPEQAVVVDHKNINWDALHRSAIVHFVGNARPKYLERYLNGQKNLESKLSTSLQQLSVFPFETRAVLGEMPRVFLEKIGLGRA